MATAKEPEVKKPRLQSSQPQEKVLHVLPRDPDLEDTILLCAGGWQVVTTACLLELLSPVLRGAVEAARQGSGGQCHAGSSSSDQAQLQIPCREDSAAAWLHCLQLTHPCAPRHVRQQHTWAEMCSMMRLADKYGISSFVTSCEHFMLAAIRKQAPAVPWVPWNDAAALMDSIKLARQLNLPSLEEALWSGAEKVVRDVSLEPPLTFGRPNRLASSDILPKVAAHYMLRETRNGVSASKQATAGDEDARILVTLLMARLQAAEAALRATATGAGKSSRLHDVPAGPNLAAIWNNVLVQLPDAGEGAAGVVQDVGVNGRCVLQPGAWDAAESKFTAQGAEVVAAVAELQAWMPKKNDRVRVLRGPKVGEEGVASFVDQHEGMVFAKVGLDADLTVHEAGGEVGILVAQA